MQKVTLYLKTFRRILFQSSHLSAYLPIIAQTQQQKIRRLLCDKSYYSKQKKTYQLQSIIIKGPFPKLKIIFPISLIALLWYFVVFLSIMYFYVETGLVLTYGQQVWEGQLTYGVALFFMILTTFILILDIPFRFNCGFLYRGMIVMDRSRVVQRYLRGQFLLDVISALILIIVPVTQSYSLNWAKLFLVFKLLRLSEIDDFYMRRLYIDRILKTIYVIFKLIVIIYILSHIVGLIFYAMDHYFLTTGYYPPDFCWLVSSTALNNIIDLAWPVQYLYTVYWGVNTITTISYGDIAPQNPWQNNYAIAMFCLSFMVYGYVVNQIVKIIMWARGHKDQFRQEMIIMQTYMDKMNIKSQLRQSVRDYLYFIYDEQKNRNLDIQTQMKNKLPMQLHQALIRSAYKVFNIKLTQMFNSQTATRFLFSLQQRNYTVGEIVLNQQQMSNNLYYMFKGFIRYQLYLSASGMIIYQANTNNHLIGQYQFFRRQVYPFSCITNRPTTIYILTYESIINQIQKSSQLKEEFAMLIYQMNHKRNFARILYSCYFCNKDHDFRECPSRLPQFDISSLDKQLHTQQNKRFQRKKFVALRNRKMMKQFEQITRSGQIRLVNRIQKRLNKLKQLLNQKNRDFQIDSVYDWSIFQPDWNFKLIKQKWNQMVDKRKKSRENKTKNLIQVFSKQSQKKKQKKIQKQNQKQKQKQQ